MFKKKSYRKKEQKKKENVSDRFVWSPDITDRDLVNNDRRSLFEREWSFIFHRLQIYKLVANTELFEICEYTCIVGELVGKRHGKTVAVLKRFTSAFEQSQLIIVANEIFLIV